MSEKVDEQKAKKKKKGWLNEFKTFILRGNVIDLAVGVIVGGAFQKIVSSLVNDVIMPLVTLFTGGVNFIDKFIILKIPDDCVLTAKEITTLEIASKNSVAVFGYGSLITNIINFVIMAFVVFLLVKLINTISGLPSNIRKNGEPIPVEPTMMECPFCFTDINDKTKRCPHCTSEIENKNL